MTISVIIPVYNAAPYLPGCLDSVLAQTYRELEILLIDDGSTDGSGAICDRYAAMDPRIRVLHQENGGVSRARNRGLELASGEFISFVECDAALEPDMYELLVRLLSEHDAQISHCGYKRFDKQGAFVRDVNGTGKQMVQTGEEAIVCMLRGEHFSNGLWNKLFRSGIVRDLRFREDLKNNEDVLFNVHAFSRTQTAVFLDEGKYHYYDHPTSACNQLKARKQNRDAIEASVQMLALVSSDEAKAAVHRRIYEARVNHVRWLVRNPVAATPGELKTEKALLNRSWQTMSSRTTRQQVNHLLLTRASGLYRLIYRLYEAHRTPNWDATE